MYFVHEKHTVVKLGARELFGVHRQLLGQLNVREHFDAKMFGQNGFDFRRVFFVVREQVFRLENIKNGSRTLNRLFVNLFALDGTGRHEHKRRYFSVRFWL